MTRPFDRILLVDAETRWAKKDYTLSKMTTEEYVRDPRFKAFGFCFKWYGEDNETRWVPHKDLPEFIKTIDWSRTAVLAHNAMFDVAILAWHYGVNPAFIMDTLSMARALRGNEGNGLAKLADDFGLAPKGNAVHSTDGLTELTPEIEEELAAYCAHDVFLLEKVFDRLNEMAGPVHGYPTKELRLIDMVIRMYINPQLVLDGEMLQKAIVEEETKRTDLLNRLSVSEKDLASNDKFADLLRLLGVEPPVKTSKTTGKEAFAFAKNDAHFQALLNHTDENVAMLCEARIAVKSTQARTRAQRFFDVSERGTLPVPLHYYAAHTGRMQASRGQGLNLQNLKRGSFLRSAIMAPPGYSIVVCDLSQIEPRVLAWLADYEYLLGIFKSGEDPYSMFGAQMFGIPGLNKKDHPDLRQSAKSALLGAGYGLGWWSFAAQLLVGFLGAPPVRYDKKFAKQMGLDGQSVADFISWEANTEKALTIPRTCKDEEVILHAVCAKSIIERYRKAAWPVCSLWQLCDELLSASLYEGKPYKFKCLHFEKEKIVLPSGMALRYPKLTFELDEKNRKQWFYGPDRIKLYGAKLVENIVQAVARCVMTDGMLRIQNRYPCVLTVHDEAVVLVPAAEVAEAEPWILAQMVKQPSYMPDIPLAAESGAGARYGEAK
jgi:DNA polymerase III epsilon subunit-like protein